MGRLNFTRQEVRGAIDKKLRPEWRSGAEQTGWYYLGGKKILRVSVPRGRGQLPPGTAHSIKKQLRLTTSQFADLVHCRLTGSDYAEIISQQEVSS